MLLFENDTGYKKVCIWKDEMPFRCTNQNKRQIHRTSGEVVWHEGIICIEALLRPFPPSSYAMVCMNYTSENSNGVDIIINQGEEECSFSSNVLPFHSKICVGLDDEFVEPVEEFFQEIHHERLPHGTIEILSGGYDKAGSSNYSFKKTMELLLFIYENIDNMSHQTLQTEIMKRMEFKKRM